MIQETELLSLGNDDPFKKVVQRIHEHYDGKITHQEAIEAARNLIGFCKLILEIKVDMNQNRKHG